MVEEYSVLKPPVKLNKPFSKFYLKSENLVWKEGILALLSWLIESCSVNASGLYTNESYLSSTISLISICSSNKCISVMIGRIEVVMTVFIEYISMVCSMN